jgi:hypothetical protein
VAVVAGVFGISVLGNLRLHACELPRISDDGRTAVGHSRLFERVKTTHGPVSVDEVSTPAEPTATEAEDDGHFVPAIYAWDPDVRFVYYRHVSKWM